jgi:hypothetical protein
MIFSQASRTIKAFSRQLGKIVIIEYLGIPSITQNGKGGYQAIEIRPYSQATCITICLSIPLPSVTNRNSLAKNYYIGQNLKEKPRPR